MKKILVPCDFSSQSREAYTMAMEWASKTKGEVVVLYVIYIPMIYEGGVGGETMAFNPEYLTSMEEEAKKEFEKMKQAANFPSVSSRMEIVYGDVVYSIVNYVKNNSMDLVIMGTSGSSGMAEVFIGSITEKVVRHSPAPVLAIRKAKAISSIKKILLPTLFNLDQIDFINKLKELQKFLGATLHILFINSPGYFLRDAEAREAFNEFVRQYKLNDYEYHFHNYRSEEEGIISFAREERMDLIAMATHARKGLAHLFNGSITEDVINHNIANPVWTYCMKKK